MGWKPAREVIRRVQEQWLASTSERQKEIIDECVEVAMAWRDGKMPLHEAKRLTIGPGVRHQVSRRILDGDDRHAAWHAFLQAIIDDEADRCETGVASPFGFIRRDEIEAQGGQLRRVTNRDTGEIECRAVFPKINLKRMPVRKVGEIAAVNPMAGWDE